MPLAGWLPSVMTVLAGTVVLAVANWFLYRRPVEGWLKPLLVRQLVMLALTGAALLAFLLSLPVDEEPLLKVMGLLITVVIAFSSTTFVSNAMAGLMLRAVRNFSPGDFIRVGDHFGRVTERGLFHTEIQTEDSDLTTLPNLHLASNPVKVVRSSGTIVSVSVSLGYEVSKQRVEPLLIGAVEAAGLERGFVQVRELADHAVVYRVAGWLEDVSEWPFAGSRLRSAILDHVHGAGIEIASPSLMGQRRLSEPLIPKERIVEQPAETTPISEKMAFDKAERAAQITKLRDEVSGLDEQIEELRREIKKSGETGRESEVDALVSRRDQAQALVEAFEEQGSENA